VKAARVALAILVLPLAACGSSGQSFPRKATVEGPIVEGKDPARGVWLFRPAGQPKRLVIFFHGQGGAQETTPVNHRAWIDHLVAGGAAVIYPRYEQGYATSVLGAAVAGVRTASKRLGATRMPVLALGYSRGGPLAVEYAAVAGQNQAPVPDAVESVNPVPWGEWSHLVDLTPLGRSTFISVIESDADPGAVPGTTGLLERLRQVGFPADQVSIRAARSHGSFVADHLAPLDDSPAAQAAYWRPTDRLLGRLKQSTD
jgi:pimeloyl-ACP methyl ester carboxylesterase